MASTLGIDLASRNVRTAACRIDWGGRRPTVDVLETGASDARILELAGSVDATGIDAPFGWPVAFRSFLEGGAPRDAATEGWFESARHDILLRHTDRHVWRTVGRKPLVVAADLIAYPALRCAGILASLGVRDRTGVEGVFEVYPAAALIRWGIATRSVPLPALTSSLFAAMPSPIAIRPEHRDLMISNRDAFDALVAALVARAAALDLTDPCPEETRAAAVSEGWIHVPRPGSLATLLP